MQITWREVEEKARHALGGDGNCHEERTSQSELLYSPTLIISAGLIRDDPAAGTVTLAPVPERMVIV